MKEGTIRKVGVIGCGQMGRGIAQVCALGGCEVRLLDVSPEVTAEARQEIVGAMDRMRRKEKLSGEEAEAGKSRLKAVDEYARMADVDLVIEAVSEKLEVKKEVFTRLQESCGPKTIFATNTSSLSITGLMASTGRPDRFLGLHFFHPVPVMRLVEMTRSLATDEEVMGQVRAFVKELGKEVVVSRDRAGFLVNRVLIPYLLDAVRMYEEGTGTREDIDKAMKLGCAHPMGPFELMDFIGLDTVLQIGEVLFEEYREPRLAPPPSLRRLVEAGRLGRKAGRGFYAYGEDQ